MTTYAGLYDDDVRDLGRPVPGAVVTVYVRGTDTLATIYQDVDKTPGGLNPVTADSLGNLSFYTDPGRYELERNGKRIRVNVGLDPQESVGHAIEDEGVPLAQRPTINFTGSGVSVADIGGVTVVSVSGGGGVGGEVIGDGVRVTTATTTAGSATVNFTGTAFTSADIGKLIAIREAGTSYNSIKNDHWSTISAVNSATQIVIANVAVSAASNKVAHYGTDTRAAITTACVAQAALGGGKVFLSGICMLSKGVILEPPCNNLTVTGPGAIVRFPSSNRALSIGGLERNAFSINAGANFTLEDINFEGDYSSVQAAGVGDNNTGVVLEATTDSGLTSTFPTLRRVRLLYGHNLLNHHEGNDSTGKGAVIDNCMGYGMRGSITPGDACTVSNSHFEQPELDTTYHSAGYGQTTHFFYAFAARDSIHIVNNTFKFIRQTCLKGSGTSIPLISFEVTGNAFWGCGHVVDWGADDNQTHVDLVVSGNSFYNTATVQAAQAVIDVHGGKNVSIAGNEFYWDKDTVDLGQIIRISPGPLAGIGSPVEMIVVSGNLIQVQIGGAVTKTIADSAISVAYVGMWPANSPGTAGIHPAKISNNAIKGGDKINEGIYFESCADPEFAFNHIAECVRAFRGKNSRRPRFINNSVSDIGGASTPNCRLDRCSFPIFINNFGLGSHPQASTSYTARSLTMNDNNDGGSIIDFPFMGNRGRVVPNGNKDELPLAWLAHAAVDGTNPWTDGDYVLLNVDGITYTFFWKGTAPGANQFNTEAGLVALIEAIPDITVVDAGAVFGLTNTHHYMIKRVTSGAGLFTLKASTVSPLCVDYLPWGSDEAWSRGGANLTICWSPMLNISSWVMLQAENAAARTVLQANGQYRLPPAVDNTETYFAKIDHGAPGGTEQFRFAVVT